MIKFVCTLPTFILKLNNSINDEMREKYYIKFKNSSNCVK